MLQISALRITFIAVWFMLLAMVLGAIHQMENQKSRDGKPIAFLKAKRGDVQFRTEDEVLWFETANKQNFFEGDRVATASDSKAKIAFLGGKEIELGGNSQVQITAVRGKKDISFEINLLKGSIKATSNSESKSGQFQVRSGNKKFDLANKKDAIGLFKPIDGDVNVFSRVNEGKSIVQGEDPNPDLKKLASVNAIPLEAVLPKLPDPPKEPPIVLEAAGFEPKLTFPEDKTIFFTTLPLGSSGESNYTWPLTVSMPVSLPKNGKWNPFIDLQKVKALNKFVRLSGERDLKDSTFNIPIKKLASLGIDQSPGGSSEISFEVQAGARVSLKDKFTESKAGEKRVYKLISLGDFGVSPVAVHLSDLNEGGESSPWFTKAKEITSGEATFHIVLETAKNISLLDPLIRGAGGVLVEKTEFPQTKEGIFVVKNDVIIAQLKGSGLTKATARKLRKALEADLVFKGEAESMLNVKGMSTVGVSQMIKSILSSGKELYMLGGDTTIAINRKFVEENKTVAEFVDKNARAVFSKPIQVIDVR